MKCLVMLIFQFTEVCFDGQIVYLPKEVTLSSGLAPNESLGLMHTSGGGAHSGRGRTSFLTRWNSKGDSVI